MPCEDPVNDSCESPGANSSIDIADTFNTEEDSDDC